MNPRYIAAMEKLAEIGDGYSTTAAIARMTRKGADA